MDKVKVSIYLFDINMDKFVDKYCQKKYNEFLNYYYYDSKIIYELFKKYVEKEQLNYSEYEKIVHNMISDLDGNKICFYGIRLETDEEYEYRIKAK